MRRNAPLMTLLAVVVLGGALLALNLFGDPGNQNGRPSPAPAAASGTAVAGTAAPTAAPAGAPATTAPAQGAPATAAAAPPVVAEKAYTGRSSGREVSVAIAVKNGRAVGYVCDGKSIEAWLEGTLVGPKLTLKSANGAATIDGTVDANRASGTVQVNGKQWPYSAKTVTGRAGLYEGRASVRGVLNRVGWIVQADGSQTGLLDNGGGTAPAPVLDPARLDAVTIDGAPVVVRTIAGGDAVIAS